MSAERAVVVILTEIDCGRCGGTYAINERFRQQCWQEGTSWTCPYCKVSWGYAHDNENSRLKRALEAEKQRKDAALARANEEAQRRAKVEHRLRAQKGLATKLRRRAAAGVCPCCKRTFENLARHMGTKHPDYGSER